MNNSNVTSIYLGQYKDNDYVFALTYESAIEMVKNHYAYGNPAENEYAVSNKWATTTTEDGWKIQEKKVPTIQIIVELKKGNGTSHVIWDCPFCNSYYSDDWNECDSFPVLLICDCNNQPKYFIGVEQ